jgi:hypothetical protein
VTDARPSAALAGTTATKSSDARARRLGIGVVLVLGSIIAVNLLASGVDHAVGGREPSGVAGSSYGTQGTGLAGLTALVSHYGHLVSRRAGSLANAPLDPAASLFVIQPQTLTETDDAALLEFVTAGGRLIIGGSDPFYLHRLRDRPPTWAANGETTYAEIDPRLGRIGDVKTAGTGEWTAPGSGTVIAHAGDAALLTFDRVGRGGIFFLADPSPLENTYLASADNAAFALALAGDSRPVEFAEGVHGFGEKRGLGAIPTPWKLALAILGLAAIVLAWSRGRRFGPPDRPERELSPARAEYVRALVISLERTRDPVRALTPMQQWARSHVARRAHLRPDASPEEVDRAAIALGYDEAERAAIWYPPTDNESALTLGRLVSRMSQHDGRKP